MASLVMIVDDHAVIRRMVREVFEAEDLNVFDAANGAEGVQKAQEVKKFAGILYPNCLAPVEFIDYQQIASNV